MILSCNYEEMTALNAAVERVLGARDTGGVAAPPQVVADIEALSPRLTGDMSVESLAEVRGIERAVRFLLDGARREMDRAVLAMHPAAESAVASYFDYAHLLTFLDRTRQVGSEMAAIIQLTAGQAPAEDGARRFTLPES